jgi:hypothetical protein
MAKDSAKPVSSFETENTGGILSGFLAEEDDFDRHSLLRLGTWGAASVGAVIVAVLANQSSIGLRREQVAAVDLARQSQQIQSIAKESQNETRRLASAIDTLNGDRDRLYSRVSVLEQGLDSVTGSLARQNAVAPQPAVVPAATTTAELPAVPQNPAPVVAPVDATMAAVVEKPKAAAKPPAPATAVVASASASNTPPANASAAIPSVANPPVASSPAANPAAATPVPLMASKSIMAPPDAAAGKLIEPPMPVTAVPAPSAPDMVASVAAKDSQAKDTPPKDAPAKDSNKDSKDSAAKENSAKEAIAGKPNASPAPPSNVTVQRTEFAVDVGGANSVGGLRALWRGLLKTRANAPLAALQPIIVVKESNTGMGMQLRLVAGPLSDAAAAAKICATMLENERPCETTVFDGQRLTMKDEDTPAAGKLSSLKPGSDKSASEKLATEKTDAEKSDSDKTGSIGPNAEKHTASNPVLMRPGSGKYSYRHHSSKRVVAEEPPPPKPESTAASTISSFFSRR